MAMSSMFIWESGGDSSPSVLSLGLQLIHLGALYFHGQFCPRINYRTVWQWKAKLGMSTLRSLPPSPNTTSFFLSQCKVKKIPIISSHVINNRP